MKLFKLAVITAAVLSVAGCSSSPSNPDTSYKVSMSPAYVDLMMEKAKAEERARLMAELAAQNKGDKRFADIKVRQLESQVQNMQDDRVEQIATENKMTYGSWQAEQEQKLLAEEQARAEKARAEAAEADMLRAEKDRLAAEAAEIARAEEVRLAELRHKQTQMQQARAEEAAEPEPVRSSSVQLNAAQEDELARIEPYQAPVVEPVVEPEPVAVAPEPVVEPEPVAVAPEPVVTPEPVATPEPVRAPAESPATAGQPSQYTVVQPQRSYSMVNSVRPSSSYQTNQTNTYSPSSSPTRRTYSVVDSTPRAPKRTYSVVDNASPTSSYKPVPEVSSTRSYSAVEQARQARTVEPAYSQPEPVAQTSYVQPEPVETVKEFSAVDEIQPEPSYRNMDQADQPPKVKPVAQAVIEPGDQPVDIGKLNEIRKALNKPLLPNPYEAKAAEVAPATTPKPTPQLEVADARTQQVLDTQIKQCQTFQTLPDYYHGDIPAAVNGTGEKRGRMMKLPSLCKSSRTEEVVMKLQQALSDTGYLKPSPPNDLEVIDGIWGSNTLNSLIEYQKAYGLAYGKVSIESLEHLGVIPVGRVKASAAPAPAPVASTSAMAAPSPAMLSNVSGIREGKVVMDIAKSTGPLSTRGIKRCYVNQVIPQNYRGTMPEILDPKGARNGNKQKLPTLCKRSRSIVIIGRLQQLLHEQGYLKPFVPGGDIIIDGVWGANTLEAVRTYQRAEGLAYGQLSMEVLYHIGVFK